MGRVLLQLALAVVWSCARVGEAALAQAEVAVDYEANPAVKIFREYIRIDTSQPVEGDVDYSEAVEFWKRQAESLGLNANVFDCFCEKQIVVITWEGSDPSLPSVMLNSHMDVVAADESKWSHPPFEAYMDVEGNIFGRGTQDMKCVGVMYLEAIRQLIAANVTLRRTIHLTVMPDEEIGGDDGMKAFVKTDDFRALNVGFALDEGIVGSESAYTVFYADRTPWQIVVTCSGPSGHGSLLPEDTAAEKFRKVIDAFLDYRKTQVAILRADPGREIGSVTSINLTKVSGGIAANIIPSTLNATFDIRLSPDTNQTEFNRKVDGWIAEGGDDCSHYDIRKEAVSPATTLDDTNPFWVAFKHAADEMGLTLKVKVCPGTTDGRILRGEGTPVLGFTPLAGAATLAHAHDEQLHAGIFLNGIGIYYRLISEIANS